MLRIGYNQKYISKWFELIYIIRLGLTNYPTNIVQPYMGDLRRFFRIITSSSYQALCILALLRIRYNQKFLSMQCEIILIIRLGFPNSNILNFKYFEIVQSFDFTILHYFPFFGNILSIIPFCYIFLYFHTINLLCHVCVCIFIYKL